MLAAYRAGRVNPNQPRPIHTALAPTAAGTSPQSPRQARRLPFAQRAAIAVLLASCGNGDTTTGNVGPSPLGPSLSEVVGNFQCVAQPSTIGIRTDRDTVLAEQTLTDAAGTYVRQSLGVPLPQRSLQEIGRAHV